MWREYLGFSGTAFAVINGLIAIFIALLPVRRSVLKLRLGAVAVVLGGLALSGALFSQLSTYVQTNRQQNERNEIRVGLETFMKEGRGLLGQIRDGQRSLPSTAADAWAQRTEIYLRDKLGERAIARFRQDADSLYGDDAAVAPERLAYWRAVRNRVANLEIIAAEFPAQPWRP